MTGLASVSGSFTFENGVASSGTVGDGFPTAGSTIYPAPSNLSGNADGNIFSDPQGIIIVGDDLFTNISPPSDIVTVNWESPLGGVNLNEFTFAGMTLVNVRFFWIEGQDGIGDFLEDQASPAALPPTISGRLRLDFVDAADELHFAFFSVTVVAVLPANSGINFSGQLAIIETDTGGGVYSGAPIGTEFLALSIGLRQMVSYPTGRHLRHSAVVLQLVLLV